MEITTIYEDANQKLGKHVSKNNYWKSLGIKVDRSHRLYVGDYMLDLNGKVSIDTKQDIQELVQDMFCDANRFQLECARAKNANIKLIFLIEERFTKEEFLNWKSKTDRNGKPYVKVRGWQILDEMVKYVKLFGVKFMQTHKLSSGKKILKILKEETEKLQNN